MPGYALALVCSVRFPGVVSMGSFSQSGLSALGSEGSARQSHAVTEGSLQWMGFRMGNTHAYSMSPAGAGMFHS